MLQSPRLRACFHYLPLAQSELFRENQIHDINERNRITNEVCEKFIGADRSDCFNGIGFFMSNVPFPEEISLNINDRCNISKTLDDRTSCTYGVVASYIYRLEYGKIIYYCNNISQKERRNYCYRELFDSIKYEDPN